MFFFLNPKYWFFLYSKLRHHDTLLNIFDGKIPELDANIRQLFDIKHRQIQQNRLKFEREIQDVRQELSTKEEKRRLFADELKRKDTLRNDYNDRLQEQLNGQNYDEYLEKLSQDLKQKQDEKGNIVGMEKTYQKFINQIQSNLKTDP